MQRQRSSADARARLALLARSSTVTFELALFIMLVVRVPGITYPAHES